MQFLENISLKEYTTFKIGGPARFFVEVTNVEDLQKAVAFAQQKSVPFFVLGGGSNILVSDAGFSGLVIKMNIKGIAVEEAEVIAGAGENWDDFVKFCVEHNLHGIENLSLIPGTVGAAPVQNIGAYGVEVKDTLSWVEALNTETGKVEQIANKECDFKYRDSIFKKSEGKKYIITRVALSLSKLSNTDLEPKLLKTDYKDIQEYLTRDGIKEEDITLQKVRDIVVDIRTKKLPDVAKIGTAGSFFKNPIILNAVVHELKEKYSELPTFPVEGDDTQTKVSAAWLLDKLCGFKGYKEGEVGVYQNQALVLVNFGGGTAQEINLLAEKMIACVKEKTGIVLEREVQIIGDL